MATSKPAAERAAGAGETNDLANDPNEMRNRFDDPCRAAMQKEFEDMIRAPRTRVRSRDAAERSLRHAMMLDDSGALGFLAIFYRYRQLRRQKAIDRTLEKSTLSE